MRNNIVQGSDSSETEVFDLIKRIEKGLEKFGTNHRLILGIPQLGETPLLYDMRESAVQGIGDRKVTPGFV